MQGLDAAISLVDCVPVALFDRHTVVNWSAAAGSVEPGQLEKGRADLHSGSGFALVSVSVSTVALRRRPIRPPCAQSGCAHSLLVLFIVRCARWGMGG